MVFHHFKRESQIIDEDSSCFSKHSPILVDAEINRFFRAYFPDNSTLKLTGRYVPSPTYSQ